MKTEDLTPEDRQRIEQEISRIWFRTDTADRNPIELLKEIAEYENKYQREKQAELRIKVIEEYHHAIHMWLDSTDGLPTRLQFITKVNELRNSLKK